MNNKTNKVLKHIQQLISQGNDCSCEFQHSGCCAMSYARGIRILDNLIDNINDEINDEVLKTSVDKYCSSYDIVHSIEELKD